MAQPRISGWELGALAFLHTIGTSTLLMPSEYALQDTWMSILIAAAAALLATVVWVRLAARFPGRTPFRYAMDALGPVFGTIVSFVFIVYLVHLAALVVRNITEMYSTSVLTRTPPIVFSGTLVLFSAWLVRAGLEPLARVADLLAPLVGVVVLSLVVFRFATPGLMQGALLLPVLERGMVPVLRQALALLAFPFAELVTFLFLIPATAHPARAGRFLAGAIVISSLVLASVFIGNLLSLGPNELGRMNFPSLVSIQQVQLGQFFQRIDVLGIFVWTAGSFVKLAVSHYVGVLGVAEMCSLEDPRPVAGPLAFLIATLSIAVYNNLPEMTEFALRAFPLYAPVVQIGLPLVMLVAASVRARSRRRGRAAARKPAKVE
ncbi:MAG: GerAB/ArcD/ProY family transporter [Bacillota bacterium]